MRAGSGVATLAVLVALGLAAPAAAQSNQKPWEFFKELLNKSTQKAKKAAKGVEEKLATAKGGAVASSIAAIPAPLPRKRPAHAAAAPTAEAASNAAGVARARDFDAAFVPPPLLKLPASPEPAVTETIVARQPPATAGDEPEPIAVGRPGASSGTATNVPFPIPRARPDRKPVAPLAMLPEEDEAPAPAVTRPTPQLSACTASLAGLGVDAAPLAPVSEGACRVAAPTSVISFENGAVELPIKALVDCEMAATAANWLKASVQPAAMDELGGRVTGLRVAASYDCRSRNHVPGAKLSEHAYGNAIDFAAFRVDGRWIEVGGKHEAAELRFIDRIRAEACGPFKTVLGPGSDGYHTDHLHLDLAHRRSAGPSKGLYCQ